MSEEWDQRQVLDAEPEIYHARRRQDLKESGVILPRSDSVAWTFETEGIIVLGLQSVLGDKASMLLDVRLSSGEEKRFSQPRRHEIKHQRG